MYILSRTNRIFQTLLCILTARRVLEHAALVCTCIEIFMKWISHSCYFVRVCLILATHMDHLSFSNKDRSVAGPWATSLIALAGMEFYWDVFALSFVLTMLGMIITVCIVRTVILFILVVHRKRAREHQSKLKVAHLLGATLTLKQVHQRKNESIHNCDVCSICLVRLSTSSALCLTRPCHALMGPSPSLFPLFSGATNRKTKVAASALLTLLPPRVHRKMVPSGPLLQGRKRRVSAVQTRCCNRHGQTRV